MEDFRDKYEKLKIELDKANEVVLSLKSCKKGYDRLMGARPLERVIQEELKRPLTDELLFGQLEKGGHVIIELNDSKESLLIIPQPSSPT